MEELKSLFGEEALTYEQFEKALTDAGDTIKLANLKEGKYIDRDIYEKQEAKLEEFRTKAEAFDDNEKAYTSLKEEYDSINSKYNELLAKQDLAEKMSIISNANVDKKFADYVLTKVTPMVNEKKDFQKALSEYLEENSQFLNASKGTFVDLQNGSTAPKSGNEFMNNLIRRK